jgi:outer membrane immunogenic protein
MKTLLLASASLLVFGSAAALAADLPMKAAPIVAAPVFSWTGCYVGVHGGGGVMHDNWTDQNGSGGLAGGQVGCNYQDGNWVFGAEGEGWWSGMKSSGNSSEGTASTEGFRETSTTRNKYDFSFAARAGIAFDRTLIYGKAGWVWGQFDFASTDNSACCSLTDGPFASTAYGSSMLNGLLLGVGIEHAITQNWTVKLEYNYLRYGSKEVSFLSCNNDSIPACGPGNQFTNSVSVDKQIFKIGVNYLFPVGGAPLVARY